MVVLNTGPLDWESSALKSDSHLPKKVCYLLDWEPFKNDQKCFLFYLKSSFRSQDVQVFVTAFWFCRKNGLIRKIRLISKFMASQPGLQTIVIHILSNIFHSKGNQTMKFGELIEYNKRNIFFQKLCRKWGKETGSKPLYFLRKLNLRWNQVVCSLVLIHFDSPQLAIQ